VLIAAKDGHGEGELKQTAELAPVKGKQEMAIICWAQGVAAYVVKIKRLNNMTFMALLSLAIQSGSHFV